jgi:hypothetical protein
MSNRLSKLIHKFQDSSPANEQAVECCRNVWRRRLSSVRDFDSYHFPIKVFTKYVFLKMRESLVDLGIVFFILTHFIR